MVGRDTGADWWRLPDGRLHARHGPIDLVLQIDGPEPERVRCEHAAHAAFASVLVTLASELAQLRCVVDACAVDGRNVGARDVRAHGGAGHDHGADDVDAGGVTFAGRVARRMHTAVRPFHASRVTPMAAVAGAVADHVLEAVVQAGRPTRVSVNNGGDIAVYVASGHALTVGVADETSGRSVATVDVTPASGIGGIATSGWRGRSLSLGIADAVTVLASSAASADVAATLLANAVDLPGSTRVTRVPACDRVADSDLGTRLVTIAVAPLEATERRRALDAGVELAERLSSEGRLLGARLQLQSDVKVVGGSGAVRFRSTGLAPLRAVGS